VQHADVVGGETEPAGDVPEGQPREVAEVDDGPLPFRQLAHGGLQAFIEVGIGGWPTPFVLRRLLADEVIRVADERTGQVLFITAQAYPPHHLLPHAR
jgi:hypothetical protein